MSESLRDDTVNSVGLRSPMRLPMERWPNATDALIALLAFALTLAMWTSRDALDMNTFTGVGNWLCGFVASFALLWRRSHATVVHLVVVLFSFVVLWPPMAEGIVALTFTLYSVGRYEGRSRVSVAALSAAALYLAVDLRLFQSPALSKMVFIGLAALIWYVGRRVQFRGEYLRLLEERARHLEREQHAEAARAVAAERTRIAREMHDVVAHKVSLMTVQAGAARTVSGSDPEAAGDAMAAVESAGRQALTEMRSLLGVLRPDALDDGLSPQPSLADLPELVEQVRAAGPTVMLNQTGDLVGLSDRLQLTLYRLVQEALTNVLKHTDGNVNVQVDLAADDGEVYARVFNDGVIGGAIASGGHGLVGMRERVELLGGSFAAGPENDGFVVTARVPRPRDRT
ncbi:MAG: sensor histidine kinase [Pseudomonadota bacterium]